MNISNNTILVTGGGSGIGRAMAEMFHSKGNKVIIAGRNQATLDEVVKANPGIDSILLDITSTESIQNVTKELADKYPSLNGVLHNAGIMRLETIGVDDFESIQQTVATNLTGQLLLNSALLPQLTQQPSGFIMTVSSGLAFLPWSASPTYNATKAAIHSYTEALRYQLRNTNIDVVELIPPYVQTQLIGPDQANDPHAMPLKDFIEEVTDILTSDKTVKEVTVQNVLMQRTAESSGEYQKRFKEYNDTMAALFE
jgi:uncharacterized oxidoreductase